MENATQTAIACIADFNNRHNGRFHLLGQSAANHVASAFGYLSAEHKAAMAHFVAGKVTQVRFADREAALVSQERADKVGGGL